MILLDSNILIYMANAVLPKELLLGHELLHASITRIEALGYRYITSAQALVFREILTLSTEVDLTEDVIQRTIDIRQLSSIKLPDAIIAATAVVTDAELWTANTDDFAGIDGLKLYNPLHGGTS